MVWVVWDFGLPGLGSWIPPLNFFFFFFFFDTFSLLQFYIIVSNLPGSLACRAHSADDLEIRRSRDPEIRRFEIKRSEIGDPEIRRSRRSGDRRSEIGDRRSEIRDRRSGSDPDHRIFKVFKTLCTMSLSKKVCLTGLHLNWLHWIIFWNDCK